MTTETQRQPAATIDAATEVGLLALTVADMERSIIYYTEAIGMVLLSRTESTATLGAGTTPLLVLTERRGAQAWPRGGASYTGLYHFAILLPTRLDLGLWLRHWLTAGFPLPGQGDHLVSEALYLEDPDGHGIEVYRDRPRSEWTWVNGQVRMAADPVDIRGLLSEAEQSGKSWDGLPEGTRLGHIHLQVGDIGQAATFYNQILGFDIVARMPSALFISAGGYHHHIGMNIWHSKGASEAPEESVRLRYFTVDLPNEEARAAVVARLDAAGIAHRETQDTVVVDDPWHNVILLRVGPAAESAVTTLDRALLATS